MKLANGIEIVNLAQNKATVTLQAPTRKAEVTFDKNLPNRVRDIMQSSQWAQMDKDFNFNFRTVSDILPKDEDYIFVNFRALSKVVVEGHWLDWTREGVLEEGVALLEGATVYANHVFWNIYNWLGSVSQTAWDSSGEKFGGVPGINATYKIDALVNPIIARGLLMKPPAIHSTSLTVLFEFEFSHPDIATEDRWKFFRLLGEEVDGHIVRLIVTKIHEIWEASLVYQGADRLAKQPKGNNDEDFDDESLSAARLSLPANSNEEKKEKTMKLTKEKKSELGIEFDGDDVPETEILKAAEKLAAKNQPFAGVNLAELQKQAAQSETLLTAKRGEVKRLATIAELGADEGDLPEIVSQQIEGADAEMLVKLEDYYRKKAADKLPTGRTSQENSAEIETAGGIETASHSTVPNVGLHD
jgi:hypothetical protein